MNKKWLMGIISALSIPVALGDIGGTLSNVWFKILSFGNLSFLGLSDGSVVVAFTRLLIWILLFTVFFAVLTAFKGRDGKGPFGWINRNQAMVVAGVVATIGAIFMPASVLLATGAGWATAIALILVGGPVVGLAYLLWSIPGEGNKETRGTVFLKLLICLLLFWILSAMKFHVSRML
jgi:hypothetical protein